MSGSRARCSDCAMGSLTSASDLLQDIVMREAMIMRQQRHGHVLPLFTAFLHEHNLHMVMPYVAGGAVTQIMAKCSPQVGVRRRRSVVDCSGAHMALPCMPGMPSTPGTHIMAKNCLQAATARSCTSASPTHPTGQWPI